MTVPTFPLARIRVTVWSVVAFFLAALALGAALLMQRMRQADLADSEAQVVHFVAGAEAALNRVLLGFDVLLASTDEMLGLSALEGRPLDAATASQVLRRATRQNLMVRFVALLDDQGRVLASSDPAAEQLAVEVPERFLRQVLDPSVASMVVSAPMVSFASSESVLYMARAVHMEDGRRLLALAQVPVAMLVPVLMQSVDIPGLEVTFERQDGELLLAVPAASMARRAMPQPLQPGAHWGRQARLSQVDALVVAQPSLYPQLWISASLSTEAALAGSRTERMGVLWAALLFAAMVLGAGVLVQSYLVRMYAARQEITQAKATLDQALGSMVSGFMLLDAQRRVVQWNRRYEELFPWLQGSLVEGLPFEVALEISARRTT